MIDVSNPAFPVELGALDTTSDARDVEVVGELAYVAARYSWLHVIDVSNPAFPMEIGTLNMPRSLLDVQVMGDLAYVAAGRDGLRVIDVSNPAFPMEIGAIDTPGPFPPARGVPPPPFPWPLDPRDVEVVGDLAYVADRGSGLRIIDFGPEYASALAVDLDIKPGNDSNPVNPSARGVILVAILGSDSFDAANVDAGTLAFGTAVSFVHRNGPHYQDVNHDGFADLLVHYRVEETGIAPGDMEACVTGELLDDTPFEGCDSIRTASSH